MIGIVITLLVLYFTSMSYYEMIFTKLETENKVVQDLTKREESKNEYNKELENTDENTTKDAKTKTIENSKLYALSAALIDADNGRVLYEKKGYEKMPMASTTKIMTCIVILENAKLDEVVTISKNASKMPDVQLNVVEGEQYILKDLLYSLMLESHNDVAVALAEHVGGSVEGFAAMMNAKAKELGCENTKFVTPNGLDADGHYTTAVELARIASYAIKNEKFIEITNTPTWQFSELKKGRSFSVSNKDKFLYIYDGAIGIKTGFTGKAGYCFVGAVDKNDKTFVSVVLACGWPPSKNYKWHDTTMLMDYGMDNFELKQIFRADKEFNPILVEDGKVGYVNLYYEGDISLLMSKDEVAKVVFKLPKELIAPVMAETIVGSASYYVGEELIEEIPILTSMSIEKIDFEFCWMKIRDIWLLF